MGTYSDTAPWDCPKSRRISKGLQGARKGEPDRTEWTGAVQGWPCLPRAIRNICRRCGSLRGGWRRRGGSRQETQRTNWGEHGTWVTAICFSASTTWSRVTRRCCRQSTEYTLSLARGQSMYGTFGHGFAALTKDGKLNGSVPPYGPVNMAGLPANLAIVLAKKCGVKTPRSIRPSPRRRILRLLHGQGSDPLRRTRTMAVS